METLKVTDNLITEIQNALAKANILIQYKVWEDEVARDLGEPMLLKAPQNLRQAMEKMPFYDFGGCAEIVIDNDEELCIYHLESSEEYFETSTLINGLGMCQTLLESTKDTSKVVKITLYAEVEDVSAVKDMEHHIEYYMDLDHNPQIRNIFGVKVEEEVP